MKRISVYILVFLLSLVAILPGKYVSADDERVKDTDTSFAEEGGEAYERMKDKVWNNPDESLNQLLDGAKETGESIVDGDPVKKIWVYVFHFYDQVSAIYPAILLLSMMVGLGGCVFSFKNKKIKKRFVLVFCITIPVLATMFVYVLPYLYLRLS